jgi:hypothetical protein
MSPALPEQVLIFTVKATLCVKRRTGSSCIRQVQNRSLVLTLPRGRRPRLRLRHRRLALRLPASAAATHKRSVSRGTEALNFAQGRRATRQGHQAHESEVGKVPPSNFRWIAFHRFRAPPQAASHTGFMALLVAVGLRRDDARISAARPVRLETGDSALRPKLQA